MGSIGEVEDSGRMATIPRMRASFAATERPKKMLELRAESQRRTFQVCKVCDEN
jgi:hypothetical protein